jgi:hypothetical protein
VHRAAGDQHNPCGRIQLLNALPKAFLQVFRQFVQRVNDQQEQSLLEDAFEPRQRNLGQFLSNRGFQVACFSQFVRREPEGNTDFVKGLPLVKLLQRILGDCDSKVARAEGFAAARRTDECETLVPSGGGLFRMALRFAKDILCKIPPQHLLLLLPTQEGIRRIVKFASELFEGVTRSLLRLWLDALVSCRGSTNAKIAIQESAKPPPRLAFATLFAGRSLGSL